MTLSPATFYDDNGVVRLQGQLDGGGSAPVVTRASYGGNNVSIPNTGAATHLTWNTLATGTELLDRTDPAIPLVLTAGVYALLVNTLPQSPMTDGKAFELSLAVSGVEPVSVRQTVAIADAADFDSYGLVSVTYYMATGAAVEVFVQQADAGALNFQLTAYLQRLA